MMSRSYEDINYAIRPAKCIERKMIVESLGRLSKLDSLESYRYIGFGSAYFSDFIFIHRSLGMNDLVSIEKDEFNRERFDFNCPFSCVDIIYGLSTQVLPTLNWDKKTILWLDYEDPVNQSSLEDIGYFCSNAVPRSVIIVTVNANPGPPEGRIGRFKANVGEENIPPGYEVKNTGAWGTAGMYRDIINNRILAVIRDKNGTVQSQDDKLMYKQLFNFHYSDRAKMLTVGGILFQKGDEANIVDCKWDKMQHCRSDKNECLIEVPNLTYRELRLLDSQLPTSEIEKIDSKGIPRKDVERYSRIYRYFPAFVEAEL
jgi:hypothetical protein